MKKFVAATLSAAVFMATVGPAASQSYRYTEGFAPQQDEMTATVNFRVPLGAEAEKPSFGLSLNASRADDAALLADGRSLSPQASLADIRFTDEGLYRARIGGLDLNARPDQDRLGMFDDGKDTTTWIIIGLVVVGAVVWAVSESNDDDDDDNDD